MSAVFDEMVAITLKVRAFWLKAGVLIRTVKRIHRGPPQGNGVRATSGVRVLVHGPRMQTRTPRLARVRRGGEPEGHYPCAMLTAPTYMREDAIVHACVECFRVPRTV